MANDIYPFFIYIYDASRFEVQMKHDACSVKLKTRMQTIPEMKIKSASS